MRERLRIAWSRRGGLERFVRAQEQQTETGFTVFQTAHRELWLGRKRTHWMWFVFPQESGLGRSFNSRVYEIRSLDEAIAYLKHPLLGRRLEICAHLVADALDNTTRRVRVIDGVDCLEIPLSAREVLDQLFGEVDSRKFAASMRLFARAAAEADDERMYLFTTLWHLAGAAPGGDVTARAA